VGSALRETFRRRRWRVLLLFLVPPFAVAGLVAFAVLTLAASTARVAPGNPTAPLTPLAVVLQGLLLLLFLGAVVGSTIAVALAIGRTQVPMGLLRFAVLPAGIATLAMGVGVGATLLLTVLSYQEAPQLAPGNLAVCTLIMGGALLLAVAALRRAIGVARHPGEAPAPGA
jgi:hypothetical protein